MNKKIVSFGDSFIFGSELQNNIDGSRAWPGLIAKELGCEYKTFANPGCGNDYIAQQIYSYFSANSADNTLAIINWTWAVRWDFYITKEFIDPVLENKLEKYISNERYNIIAGDSWPAYADFLQGNFGTIPKIKQEIQDLIKNITPRKNGNWASLGPTCVPQKLEWLNDPAEAKRIINFYQDYGVNNLVWHKFRNLQTIFAAQKYIEQKNICAIQTYMDYELFDQTYGDITPLYVSELQTLVKPTLELFHDNLNFLDWARHNNYAITNPPGDHPLEDAHDAASILWADRYKRYIML